MKAWEAFLQELENKLGKSTIDTWLRPLKVVNFDACNLYLEAENSFQVDWFDEHVRKFATARFLNNNAHPIKIHFTTYTKTKKGRKKKEEPTPPPLEIKSDSLDPTKTFANFIYEEKNALVVQFFRQLSSGAINPIFLYGKNGVGKTHLLMACANLLKEQGLKVFYVHAETFTQHVVSAIRNSQMRAFRQVYRNQDVLIIDGVDHFGRKAATQEEFFHTFNTLHIQGKQIILTSPSPPSGLEDIEPRLISRFEWGIVLQLESLGPAQMDQVLLERAKTHHFPLSHEVREFLLNEFPSSTQAIMRALEALMLRHKLPGPITLSGAEALLKDLLQVEKKNRLSPEKILHVTSAYFGIRPDDILGKSQAKESAFPRKLAMFFCRKKLNLPYLTIGKIFDRDHSTVMAGIRQVEKKGNSEEFEVALSELEALLNKEF